MGNKKRKRNDRGRDEALNLFREILRRNLVEIKKSDNDFTPPPPEGIKKLVEKLSIISQSI